MDYTKGETLKRSIVDELVNCDTHFESDQVVKVLDICDKLGIPDMYEALKALIQSIDNEYGLAASQQDGYIEGCQALAKAE